MSIRVLTGLTLSVMVLGAGLAQTACSSAEEEQPLEARPDASVGSGKAIDAGSGGSPLPRPEYAAIDASTPVAPPMDASQPSSGQSCKSSGADLSISVDREIVFPVKLQYPTQLDSVAGASGLDACPLRTWGEPVGSEGFVASQKSGTSAVTIQNTTAATILVSAGLDCPTEYTETGMAFYRSAKAPASREDLIKCSGYVDVRIGDTCADADVDDCEAYRMGTKCAALKSVKSLTMKPCETVTLLVQAASQAKPARVFIESTPVSRQ